MSKYDEERKKILERMQKNNVSFTSPSESKYASERSALKSGKSKYDEEREAMKTAPAPAVVPAQSFDQPAFTMNPAQQAMGNADAILSFKDRMNQPDENEQRYMSAMAREQLEKKELPGRDLPVIGPALRGMDAFADTVKPVSNFLGQFYTPGAGLANVGAAYGAAQQGLSRLLPSIGRGTGLGQRVAREAITETALSAPLTAGNVLAQNPGVSGREFAEQTAIGTGLGAAGGAAAPVLGRVLSGLFRRNGIPDQQAAQASQELLALPAPRQRGNTNRATSPNIIVDADTRPLGLPEPNIAPPTRARVGQQANPYRKQFEGLIRTAQRLQSEGRLTPGREDMELESLWSQMAGRDAVSLDELIQRAYPTQQSRITPDLVQRARGTQAAREVAGAPLPVRSMSDRYQQGAIGQAAPIEQRIGRASQQPEVLNAEVVPTRPRVDVTPARAEVAAMAETRPGSGLQHRGFAQTLQNSGKLNADTSDALMASRKMGYRPITNADTVARANRNIAKGIDQTEGKLLNKTKFTAEDVATGMRLIDELQKSGNTERAVSVAEKVAKQLTEAGQTVQAASIWNRLTPEGALLAAQRKVNTVNENLLRGEQPVKLSADQADKITEAATAIQASGASSERAGDVMKIMDKVRSGESISTEEKQAIADFVADAKRFLKPSDTRMPAPAKPPKEMTDKRVADRVVSFLEAQEQAAKDRLRSKGIKISSNPLDVWADYAVIGAAKLARGTVKFADWSSQMVREFGEDIRPYLRQIYEKSKETLGISAKRVNDQVVSKAERIAESYIKTNKITGEDETFIRNLAQKVSALSGKEQQVASQDLQAVLNGFEKTGIGRKLASTQYIAMLLNPKTQVRNIVGNELLYRLERLSRIIATPIDIATSKIMGGQRTVTFKSGPNVWNEFFTPAKDFWGNLGTGMKAGWRGVSPAGLTTKYEIQGQAFRSKYNPMTYLEKSLGAVLQGFDFAAYSRATSQRMREMAYLDALNKGIKGEDNIKAHMQTFMTNLDDGVHAIARDYGKYATLQDDTVLARKIMGFRRGVNKITTGSEHFGVGSLVVPFAKTPANLLLRGLDYSPVGILKASKQAFDVLKKPNTDLTRADVISSVSRAIMGTGMGAMAYWLADKGAMFGQSNKDSETRKLQQLVGIRDFQINGSALSRMLEAMATGGDVDAAAKLEKGDTLWSYEWAQPTSMPMAIGSNVYQGVKQEQGAAKTAAEAALAGVGTLFNSSVLSGIREAFQIPPGEDNAVKAIGMNLIKQAPSMFTPSILRNINSYLDDRIKETYTPDDNAAWLQQARSNIPGLSQQMPQRVDTLGRPQTRPNGFFDVFVSPSDRSKYSPTPEAQFVLDLLNETGDTQLAPRAVAKYLTGKDRTTGLSRKVDLTSEQYVRLQTIVGQKTAELIGKINPELSTEKKVEKVLKAFDEAGKLGRNELKKEIGLRPAK